MLLYGHAEDKVSLEISNPLLQVVFYVVNLLVYKVGIPLPLLPNNIARLQHAGKILNAPSSF